MLEASHISAFYGDIQALWNVSLVIHGGEIVTFIGSNGAGKSTIMKTIAGLVKPKDGNIVFEGIRLNRLPVHKIVDLGISMVPEGRRLFPEMTVLENLEVGASTKVASRLRVSTVHWIHELFPILKERSKQLAGTLSGGEQQMLAIGRALMAQPKLLLIDEMSLGLSPIVVERILQAIQDVNRTKKLPIALVEQDVGIALSVADRGYIIEHGRIVAEGDTKLLQGEGRLMEAYLGVNLRKKTG
jgi:branched-chain amino acid transport system ATP-binding protein